MTYYRSGDKDTTSIVTERMAFLEGSKIRLKVKTETGHEIAEGDYESTIPAGRAYFFVIRTSNGQRKLLATDSVLEIEELTS